LGIEIDPPETMPIAHEVLPEALEHYFDALGKCQRGIVILVSPPPPPPPSLVLKINK